MKTSIILIFIILNLFCFGQNNKSEYFNGLNNYKQFDKIIINDSLRLIAELVGFNKNTNTYQICNLLIPQDKWKEIEIDTELI